MLLVVGAITAAANTYRVGNVDIFGVCISREAGYVVGDLAVRKMECIRLGLGFDNMCRIVSTHF